jgi:large subunit ribosomal protein L9
MRVILKKTVKNLGDAGDSVKVTPGYGRNFLLPRGLAIAATEGSVAQQAHLDQLAAGIARKEVAVVKEVAAKLADLAITIAREAGEDDKLFGSVTKRDIAEALSAEGIELDRRLIDLNENLRAIGMYNVEVKLHKEVTAVIRVYVIRS